MYYGSSYNPDDHEINININSDNNDNDNNDNDVSSTDSKSDNYIVYDDEKIVEKQVTTNTIASTNINIVSAASRASAVTARDKISQQSYEQDKTKTKSKIGQHKSSHVINSNNVHVIKQTNIQQRTIPISKSSVGNGIKNDKENKKLSNVESAQL